MTHSPFVPLYIALAFYVLGTLAALASLVVRRLKLQTPALYVMIAGFVAHTFWIGTICANSGHPPLTNLSEATSFIAWTIFAVELVLYIRYRVHAASFFVYPLVLILLSVAAVLHTGFTALDPLLRSKLFIAHLLFSTVGAAGLFIGVAFTFLSYMQDRSLKEKTRGRLWEWIPSLGVCKMVSYRALSIGFTIYTFGILTGILWSYRRNTWLLEFSVKQIGAVVAWVLFAVVLQSYISGSYRARRMAIISACAFIAIVIAILGIQHG